MCRRGSQELRDFYQGTSSQMATSSPSAESQALLLQFDYLYRSIDVASLLPKALTTGVITESQRGECAEQPHGSKRVEKFLEHLVRRVNGDTSNFHKFLQILRQTEQDIIASCLQGTLADRTKNYNNVHMNAFGITDQFRTLSHSMTTVTPSAKHTEGDSYINRHTCNYNYSFLYVQYEND